MIANKFGIFDHIENIPGTATSQLYKDRLTLIEMADQAGFAGYHLAEHHGSDLCMAPSQELFIGAASQVTKQIRFGPMVKLLPMLDDGMAEYICFMMPTGDMTFDEAKRTLELFITEVEPQLEPAAAAGG